MKRGIIQFSCLVGVAAIMAGCAKYRPAVVEEIMYSGPEYVKGEALVGVSEGAEPHVIFEGYAYQTIDKELGIYKVKFDSGVLSQVERLKERSGIEFAEPNYKLSVSTKPVPVPRDPLWIKMWGLKNYGQNSPNGAEGLEKSDIQALEAWAVTKGSRDVIIAVIDTGIDYNHPDLKANMWVNEAELNGVPGQDDDGNGYSDEIYGWNFVSSNRSEPYHGQLGHPDPLDDNDHGTHCAGTIGAVGNNQTGVVGINWNVRLMALKFLDANGSGDTGDAIRAVKFAADNGADVMSNSWGGGASSEAMRKAILYAEKKGAIFVAAAGNSAADNDQTDNYPSNYEVESIVAVAATDNRDRLADFSSYGFKTVHLAAPGVDIMSTVPLDPYEKREPYSAFSGTSMATPHVSGAIGLLLAADPTFKKNPKAIKQRLMDTVDVLPNLTPVVASGGRLNLYNLVTGKVNANQLLTQSGWTETSYSLSTPRYPKEKIDNVWSVDMPGAKAIQLHIKGSEYDSAYDVAVIYDEQFRKIMSVPVAVEDTWLPPVLGSKVHIKFSNAIVQVTRVEKVVFPAKQPGMECTQKEFTGTYVCDVEKVSEEIPNSSSGPVVVDAIRYLK